MDGASVIAPSNSVEGVRVCPAVEPTVPSRPKRGFRERCDGVVKGKEPHQLYWHQTRQGMCPRPAALGVRQIVSRTECTSHSQLLSGPATKIKGDYCCLFPPVYSCDVRLRGYDQLLFLMAHTRLSRWTVFIKQITESFIIFYWPWIGNCLDSIELQC